MEFQGVLGCDFLWQNGMEHWIREAQTTSLLRGYELVKLSEEACKPSRSQVAEKKCPKLLRKKYKVMCKTWDNPKCKSYKKRNREDEDTNMAEDEKEILVPLEMVALDRK